MVDSPIVIRTADVDLDGRLKVTAGATLVRDSDAGVRGGRDARQGRRHPQCLRAGARPRRRRTSNIAELVNDEDVLLALNARNRRLSTFWLTDQGGAPPDPRLAGQEVVILDGEDDFVNMLRHVLGVLGMTSEVVRHEDYAPASLDGFDLVIVGPGPGDPRDGDDPKMAQLRAAVAELMAAERPFLAVCLGPPGAVPPPRHPAGLQGHRLPGHPVAGGDRRPHRAGRLLQHLRRPGSVPTRCAAGRRRVEADARDRRHPPACSGPHYRGIQFHAESILTEHGYDLLHRFVTDLLLDPATTRPERASSSASTAVTVRGPGEDCPPASSGPPLFPGAGRLRG